MRLFHDLRVLECGMLLRHSKERFLVNYCPFSFLERDDFWINKQEVTATFSIGNDSPSKLGKVNELKTCLNLSQKCVNFIYNYVKA